MVTVGRMSSNRKESGNESAGGAFTPRAALMCAFAGLLWAFWLVVEPLDWRHFPNIPRMFLGAWLYLIIMGAVARSAFIAAARRPGTVVEMLVFLGLGLAWRLVPPIQFIPFNFSRFMMVYGLAGLVAHCLRRGRGLLQPRAIQVPEPGSTSQ